MIAPESIQQVVDRINIVDVIENFINLKKRGVNYLGICPFHNERSPSFTVSPAKEIYKCFGCGRSGNAISFVMEHEKYGYVEAIKWLAQHYNIELQETFASDEQRETRQIGDSLFILNQFVQTHFSKNLWETEQGKAIGLSYLTHRKMASDTIRKFQLGYALDSKMDLLDAVKKNQYDPALLLKTGLAVQRSEGTVDNYRDRIIFPIHNQSGKILGFGARQIKNKENSPKYINTPENEIYSKSKVLYGLYFSRTALHQQDECLLVEGYTDVIALHQAGIENVVSSSGTSLTIEQLRLIKKYTKNLTILYDGDAAGIKAALRGIDMALEEGLHVQVVLLPPTHDPDSYVREMGKDEFLTYLQENKKDIVLFQVELSLKDAKNDPVKKSAIVNTLAETISKINKAEDFTRQQDYIKKSAHLLAIDEAGLLHLVNTHIKNKLQKKQTAIEKNFPPEIVPELGKEDTSFTDDNFKILYQEELQEKEIARVLLEFGNKRMDDGRRMADYIFEEMPDESLLHSDAVQKLLAAYKQRFSESEDELSKNAFIYHPDVNVSALAVSLLNFPYTPSKRLMDEYSSHSGYRTELFTQDYKSFAATILDDTDEKLKSFSKAREDHSFAEVLSAITFLKLRKIKSLIYQNQADLETNLDADDVELIIKTHLHLKEQEKTFTEKMGTTIVK